ncbi:unnamed protein product, partial [Durusdinium trenchii]
LSPFAELLLLARPLSSGFSPNYWRCRNMKSLQAEAVEELKRLVGRLVYSGGAPAIAYEGSKYTLLYRDFLKRKDFCIAARWTMELLVVQLSSQRLLRDGNRTLPWAYFMGFYGTAAEPLSLFFRPLGLQLFQTLLWGSGPSWTQVARAGSGPVLDRRARTRSVGRSERERFEVRPVEGLPGAADPRRFG